MKIDTSAIPALPKNGCRQVTADDIEELGNLLYDCFQGTIDFEGHIPEDAVQKIKSIFAGKYGELLIEASYVIVENGKIVSASIVTLYNEKPHLAEALTHPCAQRKGHATHLIQRSIDALATEGYTELCLVVTQGNPAENLYAKLGFKNLGAALPKQPPPTL